MANPITSFNPQGVFDAVGQWAQYGVTWGIQAAILGCGLLLSVGLMLAVIRFIFSEG